MNRMNRERWLLPDGIDEILPPDSWVVESLRRELLDLYKSWGYDLIMPPLVEYIESLLTGSAADLDLKTFKLIDQQSGRMMGVRADITPQAARIDAHKLRRNAPVRLCYLDAVLHTRAEGFASSRSPLQVGAELFGHSGIDSDVEILCLMLETLEKTGIKDVHIDLGHVGIFRALAQDAGLDEEQETHLFDAMQRKALPEIAEQLDALNLDNKDRECLSRLACLHGDESILTEAHELLDDAGDKVCAALNNLEQIAVLVKQRMPDVSLFFDLAELRGYAFHTGVVFAAFVAGSGQELARGGRYDDIGDVFGRTRAATGFSADLKVLLAVADVSQSSWCRGILAPADQNVDLLQTIQDLRRSGERVVCELAGAENATVICCDRVLEQQHGQWVVVKL